MIHATVTVHDRMQPNYRYLLSEPEGEHFDERFSPELTPKEMLALGVFGGKYDSRSAAELKFAVLIRLQLGVDRAQHLQHEGRLIQ